MYAIIETVGKQYQVSPGDEIYIEKLEIGEEETVTFDKIVAVSKDDGFSVGNPYVGGAEVSGVVLKNGKAKKINIFTYKRKEGSTHKRQGHRQPYTKVRIDNVCGVTAVEKKADQKVDGGFKNYTAERLMKKQDNNEE